MVWLKYGELKNNLYICIINNTFILDRKEKNFRIFCYFNNRRIENGGRTVISIKTLEQYCEVPNYTIQHLINLRRLISDKFIDQISDVLENQFGYDPKRNLTKEEENEMTFYELFK